MLYNDGGEFTPEIIVPKWDLGRGSDFASRQIEVGDIDCDGDCVVVRVEQRGGAACHTGKRSCFFRRWDGDRWVDEGVQVFDPEKVYGSRDG